MSRELTLRPLGPDDELEFLRAEASMRPRSFPFGIDRAAGQSWDQYLVRLADRRRGDNLEPGRVQATFLVATVDGEIVGRTSIRHALNEFLAREGGHIGYCVLPDHRRRGYATEILRQSLDIIREVGVERVLLTCDDGNIGSATVIETCGGGFESFVEAAGGVTKRRYWIG